MTFLPQSLAAFDSDRFTATLKQELVAQQAFATILQQGMQFGSCALLEDVDILLNKVEHDDEHIHIHIGVFYHSIISGCNCADDPSPVETINEYSEIHIRIDRRTGSAILKAG